MDLPKEQFETRLDYCRHHLEAFLETRPVIGDWRVLELGTGWFPTVPVGLYLCGAAETWTFDIAAFLRPPQLKLMLDRFAESEQAGELQKRLPRLRPERLAKLREFSANWDQRSPAALLEKMNIHFQVRDAQQTALPSGSIDLFISTAVLEYIPREVLKSILLEFKRLGSESALQSHYINLRDHYSYFDPSITAFNYLKFTPSQWKYLNSPLAWQNRMRISDYRALFAETGNQITSEDNTKRRPGGSSQSPARARIPALFRRRSVGALFLDRGQTSTWCVVTVQALQSLRCNGSNRRSSDSESPSPREKPRVRGKDALKSTRARDPARSPWRGGSRCPLLPL